MDISYEMLLDYVTKDKQCKSLDKEVKALKAEIKVFLQGQKNNSYRFKNILAYLKEQPKTHYPLTDEQKKLYATVRTDIHVKVEKV